MWGGFERFSPLETKTKTKQNNKKTKNKHKQNKTISTEREKGMVLNRTINMSGELVKNQCFLQS